MVKSNKHSSEIHEAHNKVDRFTNNLLQSRIYTTHSFSQRKKKKGQNEQKSERNWWDRLHFVNHPLVAI